MRKLIKVIAVPVLCCIILLFFMVDFHSHGEEVSAPRATDVKKTEPAIAVWQEEKEVVPIAIEETEELTEIIEEMSKEDVELIALVTMAEAEGECEEGKRLVIDTILNRVDSEHLGDKSNSQFFTPYHVCELMAKVTEEDVAAVVKEKGYITINDFCCGAGATLIAAINEARKQLEKVNLNFQNHVLVVAQDIDEIVALMCYIQLSLLGVAAYIKVGDVFTQPMSTDDNGENYWFTMMYFSDVWTMRRVFHSL